MQGEEATGELGGTIRLEIVRNQHEGAVSYVGDLRIMLCPSADTMAATSGEEGGGEGVTAPFPPTGASASASASGGAVAVAGGTVAMKGSHAGRQWLPITEDERKDSIGTLYRFTN